MAAATAKGYKAATFEKAGDVTEGRAFIRPDQDSPKAAVIEARFLRERGIPVVPDLRQLTLYEDKAAQAEAFRHWLPTTHVPRTSEDARAILATMTYPFISKSAHGSASSNIRLVKDELHGLAEIALAFGRGIDCKGGRQRGYLIWQEFYPGNRYDYRVHVVGNEMAIGRRWNAPGTVFASGIGRNESPDPSEPECVEVLDYSRRFFTATRMRFAAIDLVKGPDCWRILETSVAWPAHRPPFRNRKFLSGRPCSQLFDVIVESMQLGIFDAPVDMAA